MNRRLLENDVQEFINAHIHDQVAGLLLKGIDLHGVAPQEVAEQLEAKQKCRFKLPTWYHTPKIYYPPRLNLEQASSETTARYKAGLVGGNALVDVTGGMGVDSYGFSKTMETVIHCETDPGLSEIAQYDLGILGRSNVQAYTGDGIEWLAKITRRFDWIYADPSRRHETKGKVFRFSDSLPNIPGHLGLWFQKTDNIMVKASPLLDIKQGILELGPVRAVHVVAVDNEVKELLFIMGREPKLPVFINTINIRDTGNQCFDFRWDDEKSAQGIIGKAHPGTYLYEPNAAILKSGAFRLVADCFGLKKLHDHTHLYTAPVRVEFPGRVFQIMEVMPYSKRNLRPYRGLQANITTRNFPKSVAQIRKESHILDGGDRTLIFCRGADERPMLIDSLKA